MSKLLVIIAVIALGIVAFRWWHVSEPSTSKPGDPVTGMISEDLKAKWQLEMGVRVPALNSQMKQMMATGAVDPVVSKPVLDDLDRVNADMKDRQGQLAKLGDSPASIAAWMARLQWNDFQQTETEFRKFAAR